MRAAGKASASIVPEGGGVTYDWANDTITVRLTGEMTGGLYTLTEDRMKASFSLGLHRHKSHAETFHILEGEVQFDIGGTPHIAKAGTTVHVPAGVPHAAKITNGRPAHMLMLYAPAGFDRFLAAMAEMTAADFADTPRMKAFNESFDLFMIE